MKYHFKRLTLINELENERTTDTDSDGLTDLQEVDEDSTLIEWYNSEPKFMTTHDLWAKNPLLINPVLLEELSGLTEFLTKLLVAPFNSDPTVEDTDGLLDGEDDEPDFFNE